MFVFVAGTAAFSAELLESFRGACSSGRVKIEIACPPSQPEFAALLASGDLYLDRYFSRHI